jgi:predicted transcriptional regulator of viral defense system
MFPNSGVTRHIRETMSPSEQRLYLFALEMRVITTREAIEAHGDAAGARKLLVSLARKGYLLRVMRGLYGAVPPEFAGTDHEIDRYIVASRAGRDRGALAFHTALELHGVANASLSEVYCLATERIHPLSFQGVEYRFVSTSELFGTTRVVRQGVGVTVTDRERTFLDCIRRPELAGGLSEMLRSLGTFHTVDTVVLGDYLRRFDETSLVQRTGFVLSLFREDLRVPEGFLAGLRAGVGRRAYYLVPGMGRGVGRLDREWNVIAPANVREAIAGV